MMIQKRNGSADNRQSHISFLQRGSFAFQVMVDDYSNSKIILPFILKNNNHLFIVE